MKPNPFMSTMIRAKIVFPEQVTRDVAYVQGVLCGDGHLSTRLTLADCNYQFVVNFRNAIRRITGYEYPIRTYIHHIDMKGRKHWEGIRYEVSIKKATILEYFARLGTYGTRTWKIPDHILNGTDELKAAFIRGIFDSEASVHIYHKGKQQFASIDVGMVNPELHKLVDLLRCFDVRARTRTDIQKDGLVVYKLSITDLVSLINYMELIGWGITEKFLKLEPHLRLPKTGPQAFSPRCRDLRASGWVVNLVTEGKPMRWIAKGRL